MANRLNVQNIYASDSDTTAAVQVSGANVTLNGTANNLGTISAGTLGSGITFPAGHVIQVGRKQIVPVDFSGGVKIPRDNTLPLITEGGQVIQYNYTPKDTTGSSILLIEANFWVGETANTTNRFTAALFIDDVCVHVQSHGNKDTTADFTTFFMQHYASHSSSTVDIEVRCDNVSGISVNPQSQNLAGGSSYTSGNSSFGGSVSNSELIIWEIQQ
jgi:hypothetical protein